MLEVSTLHSPSKVQPDFVVGDHYHVFGFPNSGTDDYFMPPVDDNLLLDYIDFSCCDVPLFDADGDILPDLEVDPTDDLLAEFSDTLADDVKLKPPEAQTTKEEAALVPLVEEDKDENNKRLSLEDEKADVTKNNGDNNEVSSAATTEDSAAAGSDTKSSSSAEGHSNKKPAAASGKNSHGKRKVKVDWTPELHRRFVQAVEQLGIDKAVPSRILEIMGIEGLTRHNIASHLQKYRSHRKHLMAREAEAASWAQKRQMYAAGTAGVVQVPCGAPAPRKDMPPAGPPWVVPTIGFPPHVAPATAAQPPPFGQPLHVWGHPPVVDGAAPMLPVWPRHLAPPWPLPPWAHPPPMDPAYWHQQYNAARKWSPQAVTQGTPCVPPPMPPAAMRFPAPPVPGMVPHPMYRPVIPPPPPPPQSIKLAGLQLQLDAYPSKESIDAAIGEVLVKPWLPLPLGLKPPSLDSVMSELHKQGIPKVPPAATSGS